MLGPIDKRALYKRSLAGLTRRGFLQATALAGAGFVVGCAAEKSEPEVAGDSRSPTAPGETPPAVSDMNPFVRIGADNTITVIVKHLDKGQGVTTGLPTLVADEMDADWAQMRAEFAPADGAVYGNLMFGAQGTGGSTSIANSWLQYRSAAAAARDMLVRAAASSWNVDAGDVSVTAGRVSHAASQRSAAFGELAQAAASLEPTQSPRLKTPEQFTYIGKHVPRLDTPAKTDGSATFTIDVTRSGMLNAVVAHPPKFGARVASFDASAALAVKGVKDVVEIDRGVAVLADSHWSATKGREALKVAWDFTGAENRGSAELLNIFRERVSAPGLVARSEGDADATIKAAKTVHTTQFEFPFLAHAAMEPLNCVVELGANSCDIWTGSQLQTVDQVVVSQIVGMSPEHVNIHTCFAGGSFGRRAVPDSDYIAEAAMIAKAIDGRAPVKLQWTREDDMRGGRYRPMSVHRLDGTLDADGNVTAWRHRIATQSFLRGSAFEGLIVDGIDGTSVEGARGLPYTIPNLKVELHTMDVGVPGLWWRSVGHSFNAYATEVFLDRLAHAAGKDPLAVRQRLLSGHPRHLGVLNLAAQKAGWGQPLGEGRARGIAVHESFNSFVAEVAEVTVKEDGSFTVDRVVCAVDCGIAVNPDIVRAQMEGGIGYGLSAALREAVTLVGGEVQQDNFHTYRPLRIDEMPMIEVHIVPSAEEPTGVGEPGLPPIAPAVANALLAATGRRVDSLPMT